MTTPPPAADDLSRRVGELNDSVDGLRKAHEENTAELRSKQAKSDLALKKVRRLGVAFAVFAVAGFVVAAGVISWIVRDSRWRADDEVRKDVVNCLNTNQARADRQLRDEQLGETLLEAAIGNTPAATPDEQLRRDLFVAQITAAYKQKLRETLPPALQQRDCSEAAVTAPTLVAGESKAER